MPVEIVEVDPARVVERELKEEFADQLSDAAILTLAEEEVAVFDEAPVREFVTLLAGRRARVRAKEIVTVRRGAAATAATASNR